MPDRGGGQGGAGAILPPLPVGIVADLGVKTRATAAAARPPATTAAAPPRPVASFASVCVCLRCRRVSGQVGEGTARAARRQRRGRAVFVAPEPG